MINLTKAFSGIQIRNYSRPVRKVIKAKPVTPVLTEENKVTSLLFTRTVERRDTNFAEGSPLRQLSTEEVKMPDIKLCNSQRKYPTRCVSAKTHGNQSLFQVLERQILEPANLRRYLKERRRFIQPGKRRISELRAKRLAKFREMLFTTANEIQAAYR
jgi:hypothetical protein